MKISPIQLSSFHQAFDVQSRCHLYPWSQSTFEDCLTPPYFAYQLESDDTILGYYVGLNVVGEATLMDIGIAGNARGKGFGLKLLHHFIGQCKQRDCFEIWLEVRASNQVAVALYEKLGFELIEVRKNYYPCKQGKEDALIMRKRLLDQQGRLIE